MAGEEAAGGAEVEEEEEEVGKSREVGFRMRFVCFCLWKIPNTARWLGGSAQAAWEQMLWLCLAPIHGRRDYTVSHDTSCHPPFGATSGLKKHSIPLNAQEGP